MPHLVLVGGSYLPGHSCTVLWRVIGNRAEESTHGSIVRHWDTPRFTPGDTGRDGTKRRRERGIVGQGAWDSLGGGGGGINQRLGQTMDFWLSGKRSTFDI